MEIEIDKESSFTLEMKIDGDVSSAVPPQMRFSLTSGSMMVSLVANRVDNGIYEIKVPKLEGILPTGDYEANVEVFIDGKHFVPLKQKVKLKQDVKPVVTMPKKEEKKEEAPTVTIGSVKISKPTITKTDDVVTVPK